MKRHALYGVWLEGKGLIRRVFFAGEPDILNNGTILQTEDGDIAHITCILRGEPRPLVRWEKEGKVIKDKDEGIAILSRSNDTLEESHLFVAVTSNGRRGEYICVAVNEKGVSKQSFRITGKRDFRTTLTLFLLLPCSAVILSLATN